MKKCFSSKKKHFLSLIIWLNYKFQTKNVISAWTGKPAVRTLLALAASGSDAPHFRMIYTSWTLRVSITTQCRGVWLHPAKQQTEQLQSFQTSQDRTFFASMFTFSGRRGGAKVWKEPCSPDRGWTDGLTDGWTFRTRPALRRTAPVQTAKPT